MAPEILTDIIKQYDYRVDIWSVGVCLYEFLHGITPFECCGYRSNEDVYNRINKLDYSFKHNISVDTKKLIECILKIDPKERVSLNEILNSKLFINFNNIL